jgi:hypothetical protein
MCIITSLSLEDVAYTRGPVSSYTYVSPFPGFSLHFSSKITIGSGAVGINHISGFLLDRS